jgi:CBS domain-containing protein
VARIEYASCRHAGAGAEARRENTRAAADETPVSAVMTTDVFAVRPDVSLEALMGLFLERGFGGVPVVDEEGRPVGVVSKTDLLEQRFVAGDTGEATARGWQASRGHYRVQLGPGVHAEQLARESVAEAMTRAALTVPENAPVAQAAALMAARGIHRVLVVSADGRLSGIVTSSDVMRWIAERAGRLQPEA